MGVTIDEVASDIDTPIREAVGERQDRGDTPSAAADEAERRLRARLRRLQQRQLRLMAD